MACYFSDFEVLLFVLVATFFCTAVPASGVGQCSQQSQTLYGAANRALENCDYMKQTVPSQTICGKECMMDKNCRSINFNKLDKLCTLNNSSRLQYPERLLEKQGNVYFDKDKNTHQFSMSDDNSPALSQNTSASVKKSTAPAGSCKQLLEAGNHNSGVYTIHPARISPGLEVYCDMETDRGGWIVFQRRQNGSENFHRTWSEYRSGFGDLSGEFWLGNNLVSLILNRSSQYKWDLRVDILAWDGVEAWAKYKDFKISSEENLFSLHYAYYDNNSTAGDALFLHKDEHFTTYEVSWEGTALVAHFKGAWWIRNGLMSNLNSEYYPYPGEMGLKWNTFRGKYYSFRSCSMKIREM
ncbi:fibrinogen-like protein A [Acanthaster planci]|uniref:Fibrinogen-like protein A n=1 Tax=Acanthaster planci TaxID=133434 RepID=A0A8B7XW78_ACAPL|nr:fibrinogen-like protein A [Acanthaster planci]